nr:NADH dehydrogenase subunit 2 [Monopis longella]
MFFNSNFNMMFFYFILFFSTLIAISSNNFFGCWIGLEINLLSFIPIISLSNNLLSTESSLKYFLVQSIASMNFLFMIIMNMINFKLFMVDNFSSMFINSSLTLKMGAAPFHFWFPKVMESLSWINCFILMTWQKITPLVLLSYYYNLKFLIFIMILSVIIGSVMGFNQLSLSLILAYSSINHLGWMIFAIIISDSIWNIYFFMYSFLLLFMCLMFYSQNFFFLNQIYSNNFKPMINILIFFNLLSLGGLPPFLGFFPKWIILNFMIQNNFIFLSFIFIFTALLILFFYIRISYSSFIFNHLKLKWFKSFYKNKIIYILNFFLFFSLFSLIISTLFFIL